MHKHFPLASGECPLMECEFNQLGLCSLSDNSMASSVPCASAAGPK